MARTSWNDGISLHVQLRHAIVQEITAGNWRAGARIPSERELCRQFNVSRTTTRRTISECVHEGWLYTVVGKGTYVARHRLEQELRALTGFSDDLRKRGIAASSRVMAAESLKAPAELASRLQVRTDTPVFRLYRIRLAADAPIAIQTTWLPEHLCPGIFRFDFATRSLYEVLRSEYDLRLVRGVTRINAGLATAFERQTFGSENPIATLRTAQTTFLNDERVIEYCESVFHGDLYELTFAATA